MIDEIMGIHVFLGISFSVNQRLANEVIKIIISFSSFALVLDKFTAIR